MDEKVKNIKEKIFKDKKLLVIIIIAVIGIILIVLSELIPKNDDKEKNTSENETNSIEMYTSELEKKLSDIISSIEGAGNAKVMLTIDTSEENVYAKEINSKDENTESKDISSYQYEYIVIKSGSSKEEGMLLKVVEPNVRGVAVVCEGGDNAAVKEMIINTVSAVLKVKTNNISVCKMKG